MSKLVGEKGHIYAFEANPVAYKFLKMNLSINDANNVTPYENAVYSSNLHLNA